MDWNGLKRRLQAEHSGDPRTLAYVDEGLRLAKEGLEHLARHGHVFHLALGSGPLDSEWPRMMFHVNAAPNGRMVGNEFDLFDLGEGWHDSLEAAQVYDGIMAQFAGRGGVSRRSLPVPLDEPNEWDEFNSETKRQTIADFKAAQRNEEL